jgi:hypothetical protein
LAAANPQNQTVNGPCRGLFHLENRMAKATAHARVFPTLILVANKDGNGKLRAGTFKGADVPAARKAAASLGIQAVDVRAPDLKKLAAQLPAGRIHEQGAQILSPISNELATALLNLTKPPNATGNTTAKPILKMPRLPKGWHDIKVGDLVLAQDDDPKDGWWQSTVIEAHGDIIKLRWPRSERGRPFQRHRSALGLLFPPDGFEKTQTNAKASVESLYPKDWAHISEGHIVLAKEDGPCEQWWDADVRKADKDQLTLIWRAALTLPELTRPRLSVALLHPAPKTR